MNEVFPQAVIAGNFIFLSGMPGLDPVSGQVVSSSFEEQTRQAFVNIKTVLEEAGSNMNKIVKTTIFMVSGNDFAIVNKVYAEFFPTESPARSTPQVMPFPGGILISIECIALL
jgi:2-iminobutanoate/2-iminopropanoate deaminase